MRLLAPAAAALLLVAAASPARAVTAEDQPPGAEIAERMRTWLKLSDEQMEMLKPTIARRLVRVETGLEALHAGPRPDLGAFIEELGRSRRDFNAALPDILTPEQLKQWEGIRAEVEKDVVTGMARKRVEALRPVMKLSDDQTKVFVLLIAQALQKKLDLIRTYGDGRKITDQDRAGAAQSVQAIDKAVIENLKTFVSPDQIDAYQAALARRR